MNISDIRKQIQDIIYQWTGEHVGDTSKNLFDSTLAIRTPDLLYAFFAMEKTFSVTAFNFLNERTYRDFNINCLATYIYEQMTV